MVSRLLGNYPALRQQKELYYHAHSAEAQPNLNGQGHVADPVLCHAQTAAQSTKAAMKVKCPVDHGISDIRLPT